MTDRQRFATLVEAEETDLGDMPPGLFLLDGQVCFKTDYSRTIDPDVNGGYPSRPECYNSSGEAMPYVRWKTRVRPLVTTRIG